MVKRLYCALLVSLVVVGILTPVPTAAQTSGNRCVDASNARQRSANPVNGANFNGDTFVFQSTFAYYTQATLPVANVDQGATTLRSAMVSGADSWDGYRALRI